MSLVKLSLLVKCALQFNDGAVSLTCLKNLSGESVCRLFENDDGNGNANDWAGCLRQQK